MQGRLCPELFAQSFSADISGYRVCLYDEGQKTLKLKALAFSTFFSGQDLQLR